MPTRLAVLPAVILLAVLMAGCGGSSVETDGSRTGTTTGEVTIPSPDEAPAGGTPVGAAAKSCDSYTTDAEGLRATGISCDQARQVLFGWQREGSCSLPSGASRRGCLTRSYRCQTVRTDRGAAVSCSRSGQSIAFIAKRG